MSLKPFRFLDLPKEIRDIIYRYKVICTDSKIVFNRQGRLNHDSEVSQATMFLLTNKIINAEASPIFYANHRFIFHKVTVATEFISAIGNHNASQIKELNLGAMTYTQPEAKQIACCAEAAMKITAEHLGEVCSGLELLDFLPDHMLDFENEIFHATRFKYWTDDSFIAIMALTRPFPWLKYVSYDSRDEESVEMTSIKTNEIDGKDMRLDVETEHWKWDCAKESLYGPW